MKIGETFRVKQEDTEEQTGWFHSQKVNSLLKCPATERKDHFWKV